MSSIPTQVRVARDFGLEAIVHSWALQPEKWRHLVYFAEPRVRIRLFADDEVEVRLLTWLPGQGSDLHDHGGSAGCMRIIEGSLWERIAFGHSLVESRWDSGEASSFRNDIIHDVKNHGNVPAVTLHAYRPAITNFTRYEVREGRVLPLSVQ